MKNKIKKIIEDAFTSKDHEGTWFYDLCKKDGKRWAIVIAWMDWDNTGDWKLYGKVAWQTTNSMMQCDYDIDWTYPIDSDGECDDTELELTKTSIDNDIDWLLAEWERVKELYVDNLIWWKKVQEAAEAVGFSVHGNSDDNYFDFSINSPEGQDCNIEITAATLSELKEELKNYHMNFDVSYEAYLWLNSTGHGANGAPDDMRDVYNDMEWFYKKAVDLSYKINEITLREV